MPPVFRVPPNPAARALRTCGAALLGMPCWAGLLGAPVGGGPPASRPRRELRSARRLEARLSHDTLIPGEQES